MSLRRTRGLDAVLCRARVWSLFLLTRDRVCLPDRQLSAEASGYSSDVSECDMFVIILQEVCLQVVLAWNRPRIAWYIKKAVFAAGNRNGALTRAGRSHSADERGAAILRRYRAVISGRRIGASSPPRVITSMEVEM